MKKLSALALGIAGIALATGPAQTQPSGPTCYDQFGTGWATHGQHIVGDYVSGLGSVGLDWPPSGQDIGDAVSSNGGAAVPGGPGPAAHFLNNVAPGASFCNDSNSPGDHFAE